MEKAINIESFALGIMYTYNGAVIDAVTQVMPIGLTDRFGIVAYSDSVSIRAKWKYLILPQSYRTVLNLTIDDIAYATGDDVILQLGCISRSI